MEEINNEKFVFLDKLLLKFNKYFLNKLFETTIF